MVKRNIISIDESKCDGCGICVTACHEGAIEIIDGKAKLVSDAYCDGLGDCLPECPTGAIQIIEREALPFDEEAVKERMAARDAQLKNAQEDLPCGCPGSAARQLRTTAKEESTKVIEDTSANTVSLESQLRQWPVQLNLISTQAPYLNNANLLVAADCTAYAYANFHNDFIKDHITVIGCPKLDDVRYYQEKLTEILASNNIKSITVVRMSVPCCGGIVNAVKNAMLQSQTIVPYKEVIITPEGEIL